MSGVRAVFATTSVAKTAYGFAVVDRTAEEGVGPLGRMASASPAICTTTRRSAADDTDICNERATRDTRDVMINHPPIAVAPTTMKAANPTTTIAMLTRIRIVSTIPRIRPALSAPVETYIPALHSR